MTTMYYGWDQAPSDFDFDPEDAIVALFRGGLANGGYGGYFYRADKEVYADVAGTVTASEGGGVKLWRDLSGNGAHLTTKFGADPLYRALGGRSVQFNGAQSMGVTGKTTDHSNFELFLKIEGTGVVDNNGPRIMYEGLGNTANNDGFLATDLALVGNWNTSQFALWGFVQKALNTPGGGGMTAPGVYNVQKRGPVVTIFKDGAQVATLGGIASTNPAANASRLVIGASSTSTAQNSFRPFTGRYGAILRFDGELTDVQRQLITDFMTNFDIEVREPIKFGDLQGALDTAFHCVSMAYDGGKIIAEGNGGNQYAAKVSTGKDDLTVQAGVWNSGTKCATQQEIIFGDNEFVSVGQTQVTVTNKALSSASRVAVPGTFRSIAYSPELNRYVAVTTTGVIYSSEDGVTWTSRYTTSPTSFGSVVWLSGENMFVAVVGASVMTSPGGTIWTKTTVSALAGNSYKLRWSQALGQLILGVDQNKIFVSNDKGATWTAATLGGAAWPTSSVLEVRWAAGTWNMWVVTGLNLCHVSVDGVAWTSISIPSGNWQAAQFNPTDNSLLAIEYNQGRYCFAELT